MAVSVESMAGAAGALLLGDRGGNGGGVALNSVYGGGGVDVIFPGVVMGNKVSTARREFRHENISSL